MPAFMCQNIQNFLITFIWHKSRKKNYFKRLKLQQPEILTVSTTKWWMDDLSFNRTPFNKFMYSLTFSLLTANDFHYIPPQHQLEPKFDSNKYESKLELVPAFWIIWKVKLFHHDCISKNYFGKLVLKVSSFSPI